MNTDFFIILIVFLNLLLEFRFQSESQINDLTVLFVPDIVFDFLI